MKIKNIYCQDCRIVVAKLRTTFKPEQNVCQSSVLCYKCAMERYELSVKVKEKT